MTKTKDRFAAERRAVAEMAGPHMTIREKLAALLIGNERVEEQADARAYRRLWEKETRRTGNLRASIRSIYESLEGQKSGTARRVSRMCEEALK